MTSISTLAAGLAVLLAAAIFEAMPQVVLGAHGGMGIGSGLLLAESVQLVSLGLGAVAAAVLVAGGAPWSAALGGAALLFLGAATLNLEHDAGIGSLTMSHGLSGAGLGAVMSVAFLRVAEERSLRILAIGLLLLAAVAGRAVVGTLVGWGPGSLFLLAAGVAILSVGMVLGRSGEAGGAGAFDDQGAQPVTPLPATSVLVVAGLAIAVGFVAVLAGAEANLVLVTLVMAPLGPQQLDMLHVWRAILLVGGVGLVAVGGAIVQRRQRFSSGVRLALAATAAAAVMSAAAVAAVRMASAVGAARSGGGSVAAVDSSALAATAAGLVIGAAALHLTAGRRVLSIGSVIVLASGTALALAWLAWPALRPWLHPAVLAAWVGAGAGVISMVLRVALAEAHRRERALALVGGLTVAALFAGLGTVVGTAAALPLVSGDPVAISVASVGTLLAIAGLVLGLLHAGRALPTGQRVADAPQGHPSGRAEPPRS